jgi:hypothetical protein
MVITTKRQTTIMPRQLTTMELHPQAPPKRQIITVTTMRPRPIRMPTRHRRQRRMFTKTVRSTLMPTNRIFVRLAAIAGLLVTSAAYAAEPLSIDVHRDANCGCCKKWIAHLEANGFKVTDHVETDMSAVKQKLGVAPRLASCHTAVIDGKFVEGHVPAEQIRELRGGTIWSGSPYQECQLDPQAWRLMA